VVLVLLAVQVVEQLQAQAVTELHQASQGHLLLMVVVAQVVDLEALFMALLRLERQVLVVVVKVI